MRLAILIVLLTVATSARSQVWNESFGARDTEMPQHSFVSPKRALADMLLVKLGIVDEKSPFVAMSPINNDDYTGKIETSYKIRLSRSRIYVGVHVRF